MSEEQYKSDDATKLASDVFAGKLSVEEDREWAGPDGKKTDWEAEALDPHHSATRGHGPTPQAALTALADALRTARVGA